MANIKEELKAKVMKAQNAGEVADLLKEAGEDAGPAEQIWNEMSSRKASEELSMDELDAISGGSDRDWPTDGCAASVEPNSWWCRSNDACWYWDVTYNHEPSTVKCPKCGGTMYVARKSYATNPSDDATLLKCVSCGYQEWH